MAPAIDIGRALVVDDDATNRTLAHAYLDALGWCVDECVDGYSTLAYLRQCTPALILLDIRMPGLHGTALAKIIRTTHPAGSVRLVAYTAHATHEEEAYILSTGFDTMLTKPVSFADFQKVVGEARKNEQPSVSAFL
ncbi:response regulator [Polaromonas sp.]|uniref:response regulator n=1 Tax=Polaromonas sp. TaxID=1869339 RepID=UPI0035655F2C